MFFKKMKFTPFKKVKFTPFFPTSAFHFFFFSFILSRRGLNYHSISNINSLETMWYKTSSYCKEVASILAETLKALRHIGIVCGLKSTWFLYDYTNSQRFFNINPKPNIQVYACVENFSKVSCINAPLRYGER